MQTFKRLLSMRCLVVSCLFVASIGCSTGAVREVGPIEITVGHLDEVLPFYTNTLPFELLRISTATGPAMAQLLNLPGAETRSAELKLGDERIILTEHLCGKGRLIPADSRSFDLWFQHLAIVVRDMDAAYARLRDHKVRHISTAPQTLPAWNKDAGGIKAFYFRDPEDHVLELIWFPPGKGDSKWQTRGDTESASSPRRLPGIFLGIDHTAIVVSDTDRSLGFYTNVLGLRVVGGAENHGTEQEHLNQVFGARLRITALRAERGPGIEFLEYITPPGGRSLPYEARANDRLFWRTHLIADGFKFIYDGKGGMHARPISTSGASGSFIVRDPDGHALQLRTASRQGTGREPRR